MTTTEHDQPSPEQARKKPVYERTLRPNYSGVLDHTAEAALVWSSLKTGLRDTDDPSQKRSFQNQLKIIEQWNPKNDDFYAHLENVREEAQLVVDGPNPGSYMGMSVRRRLDALAGIMGDIRAQDARLKQASEELSAVDARKKRCELINQWIRPYRTTLWPPEPLLKL